MDGKKNSKTLVLSLSLLLWIFYTAILLYVFFGVIRISSFRNWSAGIVFASIGFLILLALIIGSICVPLKTGYHIPLVFATVFYTILLDVLNIFGIPAMSSALFVLLHLVLLFIYCLLAVPMYIIGRK